MSRGWAEASAPNATAKRGESEISTRAQLTMRDPSAPKTIPSSSRLRMADQNRACRLLREAIESRVLPPPSRRAAREYEYSVYCIGVPLVITRATAPDKVGLRGFTCNLI